MADGTPLQRTGWGWGAAFADLDLDSRLDLVVTAGVRPSYSATPGFVDDPPTAFRGRAADDSFAEWDVGPEFGAVRESRCVVPLDVDDDGDLDLLMVSFGDRPRLFRNPTGPRAWVSVRLDGPAGNPDGLGARVALTAGGQTQTRWMGARDQFLGHGEREAHFGLGEPGYWSDNGPASLEVRWPDGRVSRQQLTRSGAVRIGIGSASGEPLSDLARPRTQDCDADGRPDQCESDCDLNGRPDVCEALEDPSKDCDGDGALDQCALRAGLVADCDLDGVIDSCAIASGSVADCDQNGRPDACEAAHAGRVCIADGGMSVSAPSVRIAGSCAVLRRSPEGYAVVVIALGGCVVLLARRRRANARDEL